MTARERRWIFLAGIVLALITTLPYLVGFQAADNSWLFSGLLIGVEDGNSYLAKMLRGAAGDWLFRTPYTVEHQPGVLTFLPYLLLGKLAGGEEIHRQVVALFHLFRIGSTFAYTYAIYRFAATFITEVRYRKLATVIAAVGGGLGWLVLPWVGSTSWPIPPLSFISPEAFGFLGILAVPHLALARAFFLLSLLAILADIDQGSFSKRSPLYVLATFLLNPLAGVSLMLILAAFQLARLGAATNSSKWRQWFNGVKTTIWASVLAIPYVGYLALAFRQQSFLQGWADQNLILSPHFGYYLLAWGLLALPAIVWLVNSFKASSPEHLLLVTWLIILPVMPYLPVGVQRRLPEAGWAALTVAAILGLQMIHRTRRRRTAMWTLAVLTLVSPLLLMTGAGRTALLPAPPAFITADAGQAFQTLANHASKDQVVIANFRSSNAIPAFAPVRVPIGHGPESIGGPELESEVNALLDGSHQSPEEFLQRMGADWVLFGPDEAGASLLKGVATLTGQWGRVQLYRVDVVP